MFQIGTTTLPERPVSVVVARRGKGHSASFRGPCMILYDQVSHLPLEVIGYDLDMHERDGSFERGGATHHKRAVDRIRGDQRR